MDLCDVAIVAYDSAEVCELLGPFLLEKLNEICNKGNIGLHRMTVYQFLEIKVVVN